MDEDEETLRAAPQEVREFFDRISTPPEWFDPEVVYAGCRKFHAYSDLFLTAFVTDIIVRGFTTLISQSFFITGRLTDRGVRRLRQNIRHLLEIMLPGGLERHGEGWKLSVRLRLVHRGSGNSCSLLRLGPRSARNAVSAAHIALASCNFSGMMLWTAGRIGARLNAKSATVLCNLALRAWLMGVPDALLFRRGRGP